MTLPNKLHSLNAPLSISKRSYSALFLLPELIKNQAKHYKLMRRNWQPLLPRSTEQTSAVKPFISHTQKHHYYHPRKPFAYKMALGTPLTMHIPERYIKNPLSSVNFLCLEIESVMLLYDRVPPSLPERDYIREYAKATQEVPSLQLKFKCLLYILPINSLQCIRKTGMLTCFLHQILHHPLDRLEYNACSLQVTVNREGLQRKFGSDFSLNNEKIS